MSRAIYRGADHLHALKMWIPDPRVLGALTCSGFDHIHEISAVNHCRYMIENLVDVYDPESGGFQFGDFSLLFGLEDVLYITGLPVDGKPVIGREDRPEIVCQQYLGENLCEKQKDKFCSGQINLRKLRVKFSTVPNDVDDENFKHYVRAYVLYVLGHFVLPEGSGHAVSFSYLPLLENIEEIKTYAWGAALLAHLHHSIKSWKTRLLTSSKSSGIGGCFLPLQIFVLLRMPKLFDRLFGRENMPNDSIPLMVPWTKLMQNKYSNPRAKSKKIDFQQEFHTSQVDDISFQPYQNLQGSPYIHSQEKMGRSVTYLVSFNKIGNHRPDLFPKQFGIERLRKIHSLPSLEFTSKSGPKGKHWSEHKKYVAPLKRWEERYQFLIQDENGDAGHMEHEGSPAEAEELQVVDSSRLAAAAAPLLPEALVGSSRLAATAAVPLPEASQGTETRLRTDHTSADNLISMASSSSSAQDDIEHLAGHPYFTWILSPRNVSGGCHMGVPQKFAKLLPSAEVSVVLHCQGKRWEMKYHGNRQYHSFDRGWKHFVVENSLKVGDALIFELIGNKKMEFKVQILDGKIPSISLPCNEKGSSAAPIIID